MTTARKPPLAAPGQAAEQPPVTRYVAREAVVSAIINAAISVGFFLLMFGDSERVPVWGVGNYAFDFLPQSFAIGLMASLVPGLLARKAIAAGRIAARAPAPGAGRIVRRSLLSAIAALLIGGGICAAALWLAGVEEIGRNAAFVLKVIYGAALGALVTRAMLGWLLASARPLR